MTLRTQELKSVRLMTVDEHTTRPCRLSKSKLLPCEEVVWGVLLGEHSLPPILSAPLAAPRGFVARAP
jgi:hypothetical protein